MRRICGLIILALTLFFSASANEVNIYTAPWPPFASRDLPGWGFTTELIQEAFARQGYTATFLMDDWHMCMEKGASGDYEIVSNGSQNEWRNKYFAFSLPYTMFEPTLISKEGKNIEFNSIEDLEPYKIGIVKGYANSKAFDDADFLNKIELQSDLDVMRKLVNDDIDLAILDRLVVKHLAATKPELEINVADIVFIEPPLKYATIHLMVSKARDGYYKVLLDFNEGLKSIFEDGTYDKILKKHGISGSYYDLFEVDK